VIEGLVSIALAFFLAGAGMSVLSRHRDPVSVALGMLMVLGPAAVLWARRERLPDPQLR
jgi:hypothetical protein